MHTNTKPISLVAQGFILSAFLDHFITSLNTTPELPLKAFYDKFLGDFGIEYKPGHNAICTPGASLGFLYLMIVVPKEACVLKEPSLDLSKLDPEQWGGYVEEWDDQPKTLKVLVRRMRNAIAHARVRFTEDMSLLFEDPPLNKEVVFRVRFSPKGIERFTQFLAFNIDWDSQT